ncbi:MAG: MaoC family dehydratase [Thermoanaerobacteraceae bacterium]|nr:MaoC family dehydratase [Thermoanaerobacteraceae bacterium]
MVYGQIQVGDRASFSKTVTESDITLFAGITGDLNPVHMDAEFARRTVFGGRIAHGMLTGGLISAVLGTRLPGPGTVYLSQSLQFIRPVYPGDTITAEVVVIEKIPGKNRLRLRTTCHNQKGEQVLDGEAVVMLKEEVD